MAQTNHKLFFFRVKGWGIEGAWIKDPLMIFNAWPAGCAKNLTWERSSDFMFYCLHEFHQQKCNTEIAFKFPEITISKMLQVSGRRNHVASPGAIDLCIW